MTTLDPAQAVQTGLWELLRNDSQLMQRVRNVLDEMPELTSANYPVVVIPEVSSVPDGTHDDPGRLITATIHTFTKGDVRERNVRPENVIGARIIALLDHGNENLDPFVVGHRVWMIRHEQSRKVPEGDRSVRHRVDRVSIWTSNNP